MVYRKIETLRACDRECKGLRYATSSMWASELSTGKTKEEKGTKESWLIHQIRDRGSFVRLE